MTHFAESIKGTVEEDEYSSSGDFRDIVERLAGVVANTGVWVVKTGQNRLNEFR